MNIEEAKKKWCPFSRRSEQITLYNPSGQAQPAGSPHLMQLVVPQSVNAAVTTNRNSYDDLPAGTKCLADKCMAWRNVLNDPSDGHCGLAGFQPHGG